MYYIRKDFVYRLLTMLKCVQQVPFHLLVRGCLITTGLKIGTPANYLQMSGRGKCVRMSAPALKPGSYPRSLADSSPNQNSGPIGHACTLQPAGNALYLLTLPLFGFGYPTR